MDDGDCDSYQDCAGTYFGGLVDDCSGECGGTLTLDYCGVCGGDNVENDCHEAPSCGADQFDCLGDGTECIPSSWVCDIDWLDCSNGADEADCAVAECTDCAGNDCAGYESWLDDAYCDDGTWGIDFNCAEFNYDNGSCGSRVDLAEEEIIEAWESKKAAIAADYEQREARHFSYSVDQGRDDCGGTGPDVGCDGVCFSGLVEDCNGDCDGAAVVDE